MVQIKGFYVSNTGKRASESSNAYVMDDFGTLVLVPDGVWMPFFYMANIDGLGF